MKKRLFIKRVICQGRRKKIQRTEKTEKKTRYEPYKPKKQIFNLATYRNKTNLEKM